MADKKPKTLDLHGLTANEAKDEIRRFLDRLIAQTHGKFTVRIITGKGLHSRDGAVLPREAHHFVSQRYSDRIVRLDDSPADVLLGGIPIRGHFDVILRGK